MRDEAIAADPVLQAIDDLTARYGGCWLPMLARELALPEDLARALVDRLADAGLVRWARAGIWGETDIERVAA